MIRSSVLLPEPLRPEHADLGAGIEREPDVLEHLLRAVLLGEIDDLIDVLLRHMAIVLLLMKGRAGIETTILPTSF